MASGSIGVEPSSPDQQISAMVLVKGQFASPDEFGSIVLRANADGSTVRLRDVARIEVGGMSYQFTTRQNGQATAGLSVLLAPGANALATANAVKAKMAGAFAGSSRRTSNTTFPTTSRRWSWPPFRRYL